MTTISFDEDIDIEENPWRGRIMTLLMLLGITAAVGAGLWYFVLRDDSVSLTRETEEIPVTRGAINQNLSITGSVDAELNSDLVFQTVGKVSSVSVKVGDVVQQDQVLASLESEDLQNAVASAQANARTAQLQLMICWRGRTRRISRQRIKQWRRPGRSLRRQRMTTTT